MKKQAPVIVLAAACIALLIAYISSNRTAQELQYEVDQLTTVNKTAEPSLNNPIPSSESAVAQPADSASPATSINAPEPAHDESRSSSRRMMENIAKMMENPTMNKVMEASQRGSVGVLYADLIEYLNLDENETRYFMDLLMYRQMKQVDLAMKMMGGGLSDEEKKALTEEIGKASELVRKEMENFLNNPDDIAEFDYYEKTIGERMMLSQLDKDLQGTDAPLSDTTYRELLGIMHEERNNYQFTGNLQEQENMDMSPQRFSKENVQKFANDVNQLNANICQKAQAILTPEQYAAFQDSLKSTTDMQLAQLEMAAQMFGGGQ